MKWTTVPALAAVAFFATAAQAQHITQDGRALDLNYQVGSGGYNDPVGTGGITNDAQLIAQRQTTGLSSFRGRSLPAPNELRVDLPSSDLNTFIRQSVGVQQSTAGQTYRAQPFFNNSGTVFGVRGITGGLTIPGSNAPPTSSSYTQRAYTQLLQDYQYAQPYLTGQPQPIQVQNLPPQAPGAITYRPGASAPLGVMSLTQRERLIQELIEQASSPATPDLGDPNQPVVPSRDVKDMTGEDRVDVQTDPTLSRNSELLPQPNQDVYVDLLVTMQRQRQGEVARRHPNWVEPPDSRDEHGGRLGESSLVESIKGVIVVRSLAGKNRDTFNMYMARGQVHLKKGEYYDASRKFETAVLIGGKNPMARVGLGLAVFAAGEPFTAAQQFRRALEVFPPLMETRISVGDLMKAEDARMQLILLERRLAQEGEDDPALLFLASYMNRNLGNDAKAKGYAVRLQASGDKNPTLGTYAELVVSGKRPSTQPTAKPAK